MGDKVERQCGVCGGVYHADAARLKIGRQTTCGRACSYEARARQQRDAQQCKCAVCGDDFIRPASQIKSRHGAVFCSRECAYKLRKRVVAKPYVRTAVVDYAAASRKARETRRINAKPYPESAREKARADAIERLQHGSRVSAFERKAAEVFRSLGFDVQGSVAARRRNGTNACVFDISIPVRRIMVECHGTYWHGGRWTWLDPDATQEKNLRYEARKNIIARHHGFDLRVLWEHHFNEDPRGACLAVVR